MTNFLLISIAILMMILGILQLMNKGPLLNNSYIWNSKKGREKLIKKPHYMQSGLVFILISIFNLLSFLNFNWPNKIIKVLQILSLVLVFLYAIISTIYIETKYKR